MTPSLLSNIVLGTRLLGMKIINSDVLRGLWCGFMTTLSVTPSYLFLVRDRVREDELEKKTSATMGFIMGQFVMLLSIFSGPFYLALGKPHTITVLALPYLFVHLVSWNNDLGNLEISFSSPEYSHFSKRLVFRRRRYPILRKRKRIRDFSTQCLFVKHLIFPLLNQILLPSSTLVRLVDSNFFQCNNKIIFLSSSFLGWLISFFLLLLGVQFIPDLINPTNLFKFRRDVLVNNKKIKKLIPKKLHPYVADFIWFCFTIIQYPNRSFVTFLYFIYLLYLGKMPFFIPLCKKTKKLEILSASQELRIIEKQTEEKKKKKKVYDKNVYVDEGPIDETKEGIERKEQEKTLNREILQEILYERRFAHNERKGKSIYLLSDDVEKEKWENIFFFWFDFVEKLPVLLLFNCQEWNRPFRYITLPYIKKTISGSTIKRDGMSQNFFGTGESDGKERISFSYPPSLVTFWEMIEENLDWEMIEENLEWNEKPKNQKITSLLTFWEMIKENLEWNEKTKNQKITGYKNRFSKKWTTEQKTFLHRICALNKGFFFSDILEKKNRLQADPNTTTQDNKTREKKNRLQADPNTTTQDNKTRVLQQHDPLISGPFRTRFTVNLWGKSDTSLSQIIRDRLWENTDTLLSKKTRLKPNRILDLLDSSRDLDFVYDNRANITNKSMRQAKKIKKKVPEWTTLLITELEINLFRRPLPWPVAESRIRSRVFKILVLFTRLIKKKKRRVKKTTYPFYPDFSKNIIYDTRRNERKRPISGIFIPKPRSPLFWGKTHTRLTGFLRQLFLQLLEIKNLKIREVLNDFLLEIKSLLLEIKKLKITDLRSFIFGNRKNQNRTIQESKKISEDIARQDTSEAWDELSYGPQIRTCLLIMQSLFRQYILFPLMIIAKNTTHFLLYRVSEFDEDFKEWKKEKHVLCTNFNSELRKEDVIETFYEEGFSIRIRDPFSLKPWRKSNRQDSRKKKAKSLKVNNKKEHFYYLTVFGMEAEQTFGSPRTGSWDSFPLIPFLKPVFKKLKRKIKKRTKKALSFLIFKIREKYFSKGNSTPLGKLKNFSKLSKMTDKLFSKSESIDLTLKTDLEIKKLSDRTNKIINEKKRLEKTKLKRISEIKKNKIPPDFPDFSNLLNVKLESQLSKNIWKIFKRRNVRLIKKSYYLIKIFIAKKWIDIFLPIINISAINTKNFIQLITRNYISKRKNIPNSKKHQSQNEKTESDFFSISASKPTRKNSHIFYDLSCMSQGYVFLKLSQLEVLNLSKLRSVLEYQGTSFFIKPTIKNSFKILNSPLRNKKLRSYDQWKNWLRGHCQYNSPIEWSRLIPQKWRTQVNHRWTAKNKDFKKWGLKEKDFLFSFDYKNKTSYQVDSDDAKLRKCYRFSRLLDVCLNSETKEESSIYGVPSLNKNNILSKQPDSDGSSSRAINFEPRRKKSDRKYHFLPKLYVNDNESDPSNSNGEIYFEWLNIEKEKDKLKKVFQKVVVNPCFWSFSEIAFLLKEYGFSLRLSLTSETPIGNVSSFLSFEQEPNNTNISETKTKLETTEPEMKLETTEPETELERFKRTILDQRINKTTEPETELETTEPETQLERLEKTIPDQQINKITEPEMKLETTEPETKLETTEPETETETEIDEMHVQVVRDMKHFCVSQKRWSNSDVQERLERRLKPFNNLAEYKKNPERVINALITSLQGKKLEPDFISVSYIKSRAENMDNLRVVLEPTRDVRKMSEREAHIKFLINLLPYKRSAGTKNYYDFPIPENILSSRSSRKLKILTSLKFKNRKVVDRNQEVFNKRTKIKKRGSFLSEGKHHNRDQVDRNQVVFKWIKIESWVPKGKHPHRDRVDQNQVAFKRTKIKNLGSFLPGGKHRHKDQIKLIKLKSFLWPNYRLEDLACMNRYWFDTNNGSRLSMLRLYIYPPRFKNLNVPIIDLLCSPLKTVKFKNVPIIDLLCSLLFYV